MFEPVSVFSYRRLSPSISSNWPTGITPMTIAVSLWRSISNACSFVLFDPIASK